MFVKNPEALRKLNDLMMTVKIEEVDNNSDSHIDNHYEETVKRLIGDIFRDPPEPKVLNEAKLQ